MLSRDGEPSVPGHSDSEMPETFEAFFDRVLPRALGVGRRILGSLPDAEDVAVEALARAYVSWDELRTAPHRDAWALRVAANVAYDQLRKRSRSRRETPVRASTEAATDQVELRLLLAPALRKLSRRQREAVILSHMVGLSHEEIASVLGCSVGSVKVHVKRGMDRLRSDVRSQVADAEER